MEYNYKIKNIDEVFEEFPQFKNEAEKLPFYNLTEKFKKEEFIDLMDYAKLYGDKITTQTRKEFREIAEARSLYRFCWGWSQALNAVIVRGLPGTSAVALITRMIKRKKDPFAKDEVTAGEFLDKIKGRKPAYGKYTDEEALRDINYYD